MNETSKITYDFGKLKRFLTLLMSDSDIGLEGVNFFNTFNTSIIHKMPEILDEINYDEDLKLLTTISKIISIYNNSVVESKNIYQEFKVLEQLATAKNIQYSSTLGEIGKELSNGNAPTLKAVKLASNYFYSDKQIESNTEKNENIEITIEILKKMIEWNSINKSLTSKQLAFITDFAFEMKQLTQFHEKILLEYYKVFKKSGFKI